MNLRNVLVKMKTGKVIIVVLMSSLGFSCQKYLDIKRNSSQSLIETANDCQLLLNDYANMNVGYPSDGEASSDNYYLNDASYLASSVPPEDRDLYTWQASAIRSAALPQWQYPYKVVYLSNLVLETVEKLKGGDTNQGALDDLRGQALFFRAYSFWQVAQLYTKPYIATTAVQELGVPLRLNSDINGEIERGTLKQTYDRITGDLLEAVGLLSPTSIVASRPNKASAYAMLSRVYLSMEDYPNALNNASLALGLNNQLLDYNTLNTTSSTPFLRFNKEVIFHSLMTRAVTLNPGSETNNVAKIDLNLINSYIANDLRKTIFFKANSGSNAGSFRFTGNYEPVTTAALFDGLAVDELYLTRAECYARAGNITSAMSDLNMLLRTRWKTGTYADIAAVSANDALTQILTERRKELVMRGQRWTDLRRLNQDNRFAITLTKTVNGATYTLPPNDPRYTLLIPTEVIKNAQIIIQNTR